MYQYPGVYIEELPSGVNPIAAASTSTPVFMGGAASGPIGEAQFLLSWDDYKTAFGGVTSETDAMGLSVSTFYANGGGAAYAVRLADGALAATLRAGAIPGRAGGTMAAANVLAISAASEGVWGDAVSVQVVNSDGKTFGLAIARGGETPVVETFTNLTMNDKSANFVGTVINAGSALIRAAYDPAVADGSKFEKATLVSGAGGNIAYEDVLEGDTLKIEFDNLGAAEITFPAPTAPGYTQAKVRAAILEAVAALGPQANYRDFAITAAADSITLTSGVSSASSRVKVFPGKVASLLRLQPGTGVVKNGDNDVVPANMAAPVLLSGGDDGAAPVKADYEAFMGEGLMKLRDVSILVLPGRDVVRHKDVTDAAIAHCEAVGNRMVILDPPPETELRTAADVDALGLPTSTYTALYYPHIKVANPFFNPDKNPTAPPLLSLGPSGAMAGVWAKTDGRRGVWKAPAGVETALLGIAGVSYDILDGIQGQLNPLGVNCIRKLPRFNHVVWGARTLATNAVPEWRYVPVRRTAIMIERSIYDGIQWAVFEPNNHVLWGSLRLNIETFMNSLFLAGAFQGAKASDSYFVRCGLGDTMTQGDIDAGRVIALVGFAPLKPAEFVIVRIQQKVGQQ